MKLEAGMYVRTKYGIQQIYKLDEHKTKWKYLYKLKKQDGDGCVDLGVLSKEDIVKFSFNIIDILEVGDIISFYEDIDNYKKQYVIGIPDLITLDKIKDKITNDDIRLVSILTKEQMEQMAYKVGE